MAGLGGDRDRRIRAFEFGLVWCPEREALAGHGCRTAVTIERVAIVVVTYNSAPLLPRLLSSLEAATEGLASYELIVVDNASDDDSLGVARTLAPDATLVDLGANLGYAAGFNAGCAAARPYDAVLVANPDMCLHPGSVTRLAAELSDARVGIAVPRVESETGDLVRSLRREPTVGRAFGEAVLGGRIAGHIPALGEVVQARRTYDQPGPADWACGAAMLISKDCLANVGAWDESFFLYSEETDFALRARDAGYSLQYVPDALVEHKGGDAHVSPHLWTILTRNRVTLFARRHGRVRSSLFRAGVTLNELLRSATGSSTHRAALRALLSSDENDTRTTSQVAS
jgi:N-acetylglucosaminyl-diphospho-decaprenol L-rhamnosyltransferase